MLFYKHFSVFSKFYQYLCSEFSKNTGKSVYLEAMLMTLSICNISHIHVNENIAYGEVSHHTINASRNDPGGFGLKENVAYGH